MLIGQGVSNLFYGPGVVGANYRNHAFILIGIGNACDNSKNILIHTPNGIQDQVIVLKYSMSMFSRRRYLIRRSISDHYGSESRRMQAIIQLLTMWRLKNTAYEIVSAKIPKQDRRGLSNFKRSGMPRNSSLDPDSRN